MDIIISIIIFIIVFLTVPFLKFLGGYITGFIIKVTIGSSITAGLALIGLNIPLDSLPLFFATINVIASFFMTPPSTSFKTKTSSY